MSKESPCPACGHLIPEEDAKKLVKPPEVTDMRPETHPCGCATIKFNGSKVIVGWGRDCVEHQTITRKVLEKTLAAIFDPGTCKGCGAPVYWCVTKSGAKAPFSPRGVVHHAECPKVEDFRKAKK